MKTRNNFRKDVLAILSNFFGFTCIVSLIQEPMTPNYFFILGWLAFGITILCWGVFTYVCYLEQKRRNKNETNP